jgi:hypothetical protein
MALRRINYLQYRQDASCFIGINAPALPTGSGCLPAVRRRGFRPGVRISGNAPDFCFDSPLPFHALK